MTPEQLKASILQWAMEGKLVKQDPNDEPASVLLEKIRAEKEKLVKEGKIKKSKKLPPVKDDEKSFEIPDSWEWVRLGNISDRIGDGLHGTPKYSKSGKVPFINGSNLKNNTIIIDARTKFVDDEEYKKYKLPLNQNTIFISLNGTLGNLAKYNNQKLVLGKSAGYVSLTIDKIFSYIYLFLATPVFVRFYRANYTGTTIKNIPLRALRQCLVPLPPLNEQHRIVAKIEKLMPLVDKYAEAYNRLKAIDDSFDDKLKQSILQYAMEGKIVKQDPNDEPASVLLEKIKAEKEKLVKEGKIKKNKKLPPIKEDEKPFKIPNSWEWVRLGNIVNVYTGLSYRKSDLNKKTSRMIRILRGGNINGQTYSVDFKDDDKEIADKFSKSNLNLKKGELLTPAVTSDTNLGKIAYVDKDFSDVVAGGFIFNLVPFINNETFSKYFMFIFSSKIVHRKLIEIANKSGQAFFNISKTKLQKILIPIPPFNEQKRIVKKLSIINNKLNEENNE